MVDKAGGEYLAVDIGPQPPPVVVMERLDVDALPSPALLLLGISTTRPAGLLGRGWSWVAYRSVGFARRAKRLDVPERWVSVELVTLRVAGPWYRTAGPRDLRERVVVCWTRDVVTLVKAKRSKNGTRPQNAGTWKSERWRWTSGLAGSIPLDTDADAVKALLREDAIMARQSKATVPDDGVSVTVEAIATHPTDAVNAASGGRFSPDPLTDDGRKQIASTLDALDRTPELVGMLRGAFEVLHQAMLDAQGRAAQLADAELDPAGADQASDARVDAATAAVIAEQREQIAALTQTLVDTEADRDRLRDGQVGDDLASANAEIERLLGQVEELTVAAGEAAGEGAATRSIHDAIVALGAYVPVPKRWCDVTAADIFVGRKGDLWVVDAAMGERDEFTKGKGTVRVSQAGKSYARDFDPDDTAQVLVPAAVEAAHQVLMQHLGASVLLGETASVPA